MNDLCHTIYLLFAPEYNMESVKEKTILRLLSYGPWLTDAGMSDDPSDIQNDSW